MARDAFVCTLAVIALGALTALAACGPGVDLPRYGSRGVNESCTQDVECMAGLRCSASRCVTDGFWFWQWGSSGIDYASALAVTADGAVIVTGGTFGPMNGNDYHGAEDFFVSRLDPDGTLQWSRQLGTPGAEASYAIAVADDGTAYVGGYSRYDLGGGSFQGATDIWLAALGADGTLGYLEQWGSPGLEWILDMTLGLDGYLYISGRGDTSLDGESTSGDMDGVLIKVALDGTVVWTRMIGTAGKDGATAVTPAAEGGVYVAGEVHGALPLQAWAGDTDAFAARYSSTGELLWTAQWGTSGEDTAYSIVESSPYVYVVGGTRGAFPRQTPGGEGDVFVTQLSPTGEILWTQQWGTAGWDTGAWVVAGEPGTVYMTGAASGDLDGHPSRGSSDIFLCKLLPDGTRAWTETWGGAGDDVSAVLAFDAQGRAFIAGTTTSTLAGAAGAGTADVFVLRIDDGRGSQNAVFWDHSGAGAE